MLLDYRTINQDKLKTQTRVSARPVVLCCAYLLCFVNALLCVISCVLCCFVLLPGSLGVQSLCGLIAFPSTEALFKHCCKSRLPKHGFVQNAPVPVFVMFLHPWAFWKMMLPLSTSYKTIFHLLENTTYLTYQQQKCRSPDGK